MQAPQMQYGTFACQSCGGELPKTMPKGLIFPCPYCQAKIESPGSDITAADAAKYQAWAMEHGAAAASLADQQYREQHDPANTVFASVSTIVGVVVGGASYFLGSQAAADGSWSLRMVDGTSRQVVWESLAGSRWANPPDEQKIAIRGDRLFVAVQGQLHCLELSSGRVFWSTPIMSAVETSPDLAHQGDEMMLYDFPVAQGEGAVAAYFESGSIAAWARDTGRPLWSQHWDSPTVHHVPNVGVIVDDRTTAAVIRVFDGAELARWTDDNLPDGVFVDGNRIALHVQVEVKDFDQDRVRILDAGTMQVIADHYVKGANFNEPPAFVGQRLLTPIDALSGSTFHVVDPAATPKEPGFFARLFGGLGSGATHNKLAVPKMRIERIVPAGALVFFDLRPMDGDGRRLIGLDANTLEPRFDSGPLSEEPTTMDSQQVQTDGRVAVYVTAPGGDDDACELRAVDCATGQERWRQAIGDWNIHYVMGEHLVVNHHPEGANHTVSVFSLADGTLTARCPFV